MNGFISNLDGPDTQFPGYFVTDHFAAQPFHMKWIICFFAGNSFKYSAYSCWFFGDCGNVASGFAYSGTDEKGNNLFHHARVYFFEVELAPSLRDMINSWNHQQTTWFRYYIYERVLDGKKENRSKATFLTFLYSAIWHGFYTGYYIFFITSNLVLSSTRRLRLFFQWVPSKLASFCGWLICQHVGFVLCPLFALLDYDV